MPPPRVRAWVVVAFFGLVATLVWPVYPHFQSPNELTRWAFAASLVERGTPEVSGVLPFLHPGFEDLSAVDGRTYSNKAPGAAAVGLVGYLAARPFAGPPSPGQMRPAVTAMRFVASTMPALLLGLLFVRTSDRLGGDPERLPLAVFALLFATPLFAYALLLFSHALVAACLFGAWAFLFTPSRGREAPWNELLAGALLALAAVSEYPAAVPAALLFGTAAWRRSPGRAVRIAIGALPLLALLLAYDAACFGNPFALSSGFERAAGFRDLAAGGAFGIGLPTPSGLAELLVDPSKGLLLFCPFVVLGVRALPATAKAIGARAAIALAGVPVCLLLLYAGYPNRHGGWTVGPRYLVAALPFLVLPLVFREGGKLESLLLGASAAAIVPLAVTFPFAAPGQTAPWVTVAGPLLADGLAAPSLFHLAGFRHPEFAPLVFAAAAAGLSIPWSRTIFALGGIALSLGGGLLLAAARPLPAEARVTRAYVRDVYFGESGALEREVPGWEARLPRLSARRQVETGLGPTAWLFRQRDRIRQQEKRLAATPKAAAPTPATKDAGR